MITSHSTCKHYHKRNCPGAIANIKDCTLSWPYPSECKHRKVVKLKSICDSCKDKTCNECPKGYN